MEDAHYAVRDARHDALPAHYDASALYSLGLTPAGQPTTHETTAHAASTITDAQTTCHDEMTTARLHNTGREYCHAYAAQMLDITSSSSTYLSLLAITIIEADELII